MKYLREQYCSHNIWSATEVNLHKSNFQRKSGGTIFKIHQEMGFPDDTSAYHSRVDEIGPGDYEACGKLVRVIDTTRLANGDRIEHYACGHKRYIAKPKRHPATRHPKHWGRLLPFQQKAVELSEMSNINCMLDYEMGTGKTVIAASVLRENRKQCGRTLVLVQPMDKYRVQEEFTNWLGAKELITSDPANAFQYLPTIWDGKKGNIMNSQIIITTWSAMSQPNFFKALQAWEPKTVIVDESHLYKDIRSNRTKQMMQLIKMESVKHRIFMSGTPVMNRIMDFFPVLNALKPDHFYDRSVISAKCVISNEGKVLGLSPRWRGWYEEKIEDVVFRETKESAKIPMPPFERKNKWITLDDCIQPELNNFIREYNKICDELEQLLADKKNAAMHAGSIIGLMQTIRHWTGLIKLPAIIRLAVDYLEIYREKVTIGVHHKLVRQTLVNALGKYGVLSMSDEDAEEKDRIEQEFKNDPSKLVLVASIKGAGQGRNLQFCRNAMVMERWWNFAIEDQFDKRFHRIMTDPETGHVRTEFTENDKVTVEYVNLKDSFDEFTDSMVELKQDICASEEEDIDPHSMIQLASRVARNRLKYVGV